MSILSWAYILLRTVYLYSSFHIYRLFFHSFNEKRNRLFPFIRPWKLTNVHISTADFLSHIGSFGKYSSSSFMTSTVNSSERNDKIPAGYTYLGQFIAHELTFAANIVNSYHESERITPSSRYTPKLTLDSIYGNGPTLSPMYYDQDQYSGRTHFKLGPIPQTNLIDFARLFYMNKQKGEPVAVPIIPDIRNDDNIVIAQIHVAFQRLHNQYIDCKIDKSPINNIIKSIKEIEQQLKSRTLNTPIVQHGYNTDERQIKLEENFNEVVALKERIHNSLGTDTFIESNIFEDENFIKITETLYESSKPEEKLWKFIVTYTEQQLAFLDFIQNSNKFDLSNKDLNNIETAEKNFYELRFRLQVLKMDYIATLDQFFKATQKQVQLYFQRIILYDFLPTILDDFFSVEFISNLVRGHARLKPEIFFWKKAPFLPIEFTTAFFRFGHSMVAKSYHFNNQDDPKPIFKPKKINQRLQTKLNWELFFFDTIPPPAKKNLSEKIDHLITSQMINNLGVVNEESKNIIVRNLKSAYKKNLPSGQDVTRLLYAIGALNKEQLIKPFDKKMISEKDNKKNRQVYLIQNLFENFEKLNFKTKDGTPLDKEQKKELLVYFCNHSPLWIYILMEASIFNEGKKLGPMASRIILEVIVKIIKEEGNQGYFDTAEQLKIKSADGKKPHLMIELLKTIGAYPGSNPSQC